MKDTTKEKIKNLVETKNEIKRLEKSVDDGCSELMDEFLAKKGWGLFLKAHGFEKNYETGLRGNLPNCSISFGDLDNMLIELRGPFHDDWTDYFPISDFIDFMEDNSRYAREQEKIEEEMTKRMAEHGEREKRRKLYEELKKEFEG